MMACSYQRLRCFMTTFVPSICVRTRVCSSAKSGSMPDEQFASRAIVPVGAMQVSVALRRPRCASGSGIPFSLPSATEVSCAVFCMVPIISAASA